MLSCWFVEVCFLTVTSILTEVKGAFFADDSSFAISLSLEETTISVCII